MSTSRIALTSLAASLAIALALPVSLTRAASKLETISDNQFRTVLRSEKDTIILQFTSFDPNCRPCIEANIVFEALAAKYGARARFIRVHYEPWTSIQAAPIAGEHKLIAVPTVLLFQGGKEQRRVAGHQPERAMERLLFEDSVREPKRSEERPGADVAAAGPGAAPAPDASFQPYGGVWATSRAFCNRYARHIGTAKDLGRAIDFVAHQSGAAYLVLKRGIRVLDEASSQCRLISKTDRPNGMSATLSCTNAINPDVSTDVLDIVKSEREYKFIWKRQNQSAQEEMVYQCMTMSDLGQQMARLWQFDSAKCTATAAHSGGRVTFAREPADILSVTVSGSVAADHKNDFAAAVFVDQAPPIAVTAKAIPTGFSLWLEPWEARSRLIAEGFLLTIATEETAARGSGAYRVPVLELPLLGSGRAMDFLRQCQPAGAAEHPASDREGVQQFLKSFVDQLDRELPDYKHKMPEYKLVDLNDDGHNDIILRPTSPLYCGSGGCTLFVYRALPDGKFEYVYEKQSPDESFPTVGPAAKGGYSTLYFPYHFIGDGRILYEVAEWQGNRYDRSHFADGDIRIALLTEREEKAIATERVLRERATSKAKALDQQGMGFNLGTTANEEGRWLVSKGCVGCPYGYAKIRQ